MAGMSRQGLFRIHAWIGLNLGFLLFVICFSGTVAVFSTELTWLVDPPTRVTPPATSTPTLSWQDLHDRVAHANPHALVAHLIASPGPRFPARAVVAYGPGDTRLVLIDPYSGKLLAQKSSFNLESFFRIFHKQLYVVPTIFGFHGTLIVGAFAVALLLGAITGLISIKRWWRALYTLRFGRSKRLFWSDAHRLTGVWALMVTILLSATGIWYLAETILHDTGTLTESSPEVRLDPADLREAPATLQPLDLDKAVRLAKAAFPALAIKRIALPVEPDAPLTFVGQADAWLVRDRANHVQMNPYTGEILDIRRGETLDPLARWIETADPLHFGTFAGLVSQIIWFAAGLLICGGLLAGLYGAWMRLRQRQGRTHKHRIAAAVAVVPALALLVAGAFGAWVYGGAPLRTAQRAVTAAPLYQDALGPWRISIDRLDVAGKRSSRVTVSVRFQGRTYPNLARAEYSVGHAGTIQMKPAKRFFDRLLIAERCPPQSDHACRLNLRLTEWTGRVHAIDVNLMSQPAQQTALPLAAGPGTGETSILVIFALCLLLPLIGWIRLQFL